MNYVVLNGAKSTDVKGLLIQSLPPISKPLIRTSVEEIDGRDGDIVTKLGYSAYDKQMSIGLFGDYNVDDVIQFFDSEGTVIFSNEPDKFYNYKIIQQIDFEKLLRFKTATVTFHVQPFKYSAVDDAIKVSINQLFVKDYTATKNGVTVSVENGVISVSGSASNYSEFYIPINAMRLKAGNYTLQGLTDGTGESACAIRVVETVPSDEESLGGTYLPLQDSGSASMDAILNASKAFNYVWLYVKNGSAVNFDLDVKVLDLNLNPFPIFNRGNTKSKPTITLHGTGTITLSVNDALLFTIALGDSGYITIDPVQMNAYKGSVLMNRSVAGDYSKLQFNVGTNLLSWTGNISQFEIENSSRWL